MFVPLWVIVVALITIMGAWGFVLELTALAAIAVWWCVKLPFRLAWWLLGIPFRLGRWAFSGRVVKDVQAWMLDTDRLMREQEERDRIRASVEPSRGRG